MAERITPTAKRINKATGVTRRHVNTKARRKEIRNVFRRKSNGGNGG